MADAAKPARSRTKKADAAGGFSDDEKAAMKERARELKNAARRNPADERADGERDLQAKLAELDGPDRALATRIHELVMATVPTLVPRTWYGMPAWSHGGKTICFFQPAARFKVRYATFGFQPDATLDDGPMWATGFAVLELTPAVEARIVELLRRAVA